MTRSTHQVGAFASSLGALVIVQHLIANPLPEQEPAGLSAVAASFLGLPVAGAGIPWPAAVVYVLLAILGGIAPDLDRSASLWGRMLSATLLGGHRHLSHSFLGASLAAALVAGALALLGPLLAFPVGLVWLGFVAGYLSHLILDGMTHDGVPLLFPLGVYFGMPPFASLRIRTGGMVEQFVVMPLLLILIAWLGFSQGSRLTSLWL